MSKIDKTRALVYCRVSSERQATEGHGLDSQEHRCREFAKTNGYEVEEVFRDRFTGGGEFSQRPSMMEMLAYIDSKPHRKYVVVFDDIARLARDVTAHIKLRAAFAQRDVTPLCLNYNFDGTPEGEFAEVIMAANAELFRKQNKRQVIQKMKARVEKGFFPFFPPPGYKQFDDPILGKVLKPDEPRASMIKEAFEGYANDRFLTQADVVRFLRNAGYSETIYQEGVRRMLRRVIYAGYVEKADWDVSRRRGQHEALISLETFEKVQAKLDGKEKVRVRVSDSLDFALRGFLLCPFCQRPMTGSWTRGRSKMYRFFRCNTQSCVRHNKSISGDFIDEEFKKLLREIYPKAGAIALAKAIVADMWKHKVKGIEGQHTRLGRKLADSHRQVDVLSGRVVKAMDEKLVRVYEEQIIKYRNEGEVLQEQIKALGLKTVSFETALEVVLGFLENPLVIWESENMNAKRLVLKLVFAEKLVFHPKFGFETAQKSLLIGLFEQICAKNSQDVEVGRIELPSKEKYGACVYEA
jgi:site-specific DNA recombinase